MKRKRPIPDCPACDQLMAALVRQADLNAVRKAYPAELARLVTALHQRKHVPGGAG